MAEITQSTRVPPWLECFVEHRDEALVLALDIKLRGSIAVLIGPSGSGKTSLLRSISGLLRPQRCRIALVGKPVADSDTRLWLRPSQRSCGLVMQRPALFPSMTAEENIDFGLHALPRAERGRRVQQMLTLFRLEALAKRRPVRLSGGEQQRVALARALAPYPSVLLLDEPFAGLDLELKDAILHDLEAWLVESATPALHVTHDIAEAWRLASRSGAEVLRIESGKIVAQGTASTVLAADRERVRVILQ